MGLIAKYNNTDQLAMNGVMIAGTKYMYLSSNDKVIRAKKGTSGVHTIKTTQTYIICVYEDPLLPEQAATVTEKLGDYLILIRCKKTTLLLLPLLLFLFSSNKKKNQIKSNC